MGSTVSLHAEALDGANGKRSDRSCFRMLSRESRSSQASFSSPINGTEVATSHSSTSDTTRFRVQDGRKFHAVEGAAYILPNDNEEVDRLHQHHWMVKEAMHE